MPFLRKILTVQETEKEKLNAKEDIGLLRSITCCRGEWFPFALGSAEPLPTHTTGVCSGDTLRSSNSSLLLPHLGRVEVGLSIKDMHSTEMWYCGASPQARMHFSQPFPTTLLSYIPQTADLSH